MQLKEYRFEGGPLHGETRACAGDSEFVVPMCNETSWRQQAFTAHELVPDTGPEIGHAIYQLSFVRDWDNGKKIDSYCGVSPARSRLALPLRGFARFWHSPPLSPCVTGFDLTDIRSC